MAWSRKSALFASLATALYLLGLVLRNQQLVTVAVVLLSFLTWAALRAAHADVASTGRRIDDPAAGLLVFHDLCCRSEATKGTFQMHANDIVPFFICHFE